MKLLHPCENYGFLQSHNLKKAAFTFLCVSLANSSLFAASQAPNIGYQKFQTPKHSFSNAQVYDSKNNQFKAINGVNYYGVSARGLVNGVTLEVYNPKIPTQSTQESKLRILTPDISKAEVIEVKGSHTANSLNRDLHTIKVVPFLVAGKSLGGDSINNKLFLKESELSSVVFLKPSTLGADSASPKNEGEESSYNYMITAGLANKGNAKSNVLELQAGSYVNMGVLDTYSLRLNGAPYMVGGIAILGDSVGNVLRANQGSKVDIHTTPYGNTATGDFVFDERIVHLVGGLAHNGNVKGNEVRLNGVELMIHSKSGSYSSFASAHIAGAFIDSDDGKSYNATNNSIIVDKFLLGLRVEGAVPLFYDSVFLGEFFGGKTAKGDSRFNKIILKDVPAIGRVNSGVKVQGIYEFFGGYTLGGKASDNLVEVNLKAPLQVSNTYLRQNNFGFYGAYATEGASNNTIRIKNNLTAIDGTENISDRVRIVAGRTLAGEANNNVIDFRDSQVSLPLYVYATQQEIFEGSIHYPQMAKNNKVTLNNVFGRKDIRSGIVAMNVEDNLVSYHNVEAQASGQGVDKESSVYIKATNIAKGNTFRASNYWATSQLNIYGIRGEVESYENKVIFNNVAFYKDRENSGLVIVGGVGNSAYRNVVSIKDITIGDYDREKDFIYIAASAIPNAESNLALSYANTLYIGGEIALSNNTILSALSGSVIRVPSYSTSNSDILTIPAPSLGQLMEDNHLILENHLHARVVNNFEHYSFVYNKQNEGVVFAVSLESPINLSPDSIISLVAKKGAVLPKKGTKIPLMSSMNGFSDRDGGVLSSAEVEVLLERISKNKNNFRYSAIPQLEKEGLRVISNKLSLGDEGRTIYAEI